MTHLTDKLPVMLLAGLLLAGLASPAGGQGSGPPGPDQEGPAPCPQSPNCVSSRSADPGRRVKPLAFNGPPEQAWARLTQVVEGMEDAQVVRQEPGYLRAEFKSRLLGFVDDVEFWLPPGAQAIEVRSASRVGYWDLGVNRRRVERIRRLLAEAEANSHQ